MGTRTAVFQEQENGKYLGIYVHYDGYIEGVGKTLLNHYQEKQKTYELLSQKRFLSCLGTTTETISYERQMEMYASNSKEISKYCVGHNSEEFFLADNLEDIRNMQYLTYNKGEIDGFYVKAKEDKEGKEFIAFRGSDNNGFLYVQDLKGTWYVSQMEETRPHNMKKFEKLEKHL